MRVAVAPSVRRPSAARSIHHHVARIVFYTLVLRRRRRGDRGGRAGGRLAGGGGAVARFLWCSSRNSGVRDVGRPSRLPSSVLPSSLRVVSLSLSLLPPSLLTPLIFYASHAAHVKPSRLRVRPSFRRAARAVRVHSRVVRGADRPTRKYVAAIIRFSAFISLCPCPRPPAHVTRVALLRSSASCPCQSVAGDPSSSNPPFLEVPSVLPCSSPLPRIEGVEQTLRFNFTRGLARRIRER